MNKTTFPFVADLLFLALAFSARGSVTVTNVQAVKVFDAARVDTTYDLASTTSDPVFIYLVIYRVEDTAVRYQPARLSGDVGAGVLPGGDKHIVWNYTTHEFNALENIDIKARVVALPMDAPPVVALSASPQVILAGDSSYLAWNSGLATACSIDQGIGSVATTGTLLVSPAATTTYTITATNAAGASSASAAVIVNHAPIAWPLRLYTAPGACVTDNLLTHISDEEGTGTVELTGVTQPSHGTSSLNFATGVVTYTPAAGFWGEDMFTYGVRDNYGYSALGYVTVEVGGVQFALNPVIEAGCPQGAHFGYIYCRPADAYGNLMISETDKVVSGTQTEFTEPVFELYDMQNGVYEVKRWFHETLPGVSAYVVTFDYESFEGSHEGAGVHQYTHTFAQQDAPGGRLWMRMLVGDLPDQAHNSNSEQWGLSAGAQYFEAPLGENAVSPVYELAADQSYGIGLSHVATNVNPPDYDYVASLAFSGLPGGGNWVGGAINWYGGRAESSEAGWIINDPPVLNDWNNGAGPLLGLMFTPGATPDTSWSRKSPTLYTPWVNLQTQLAEDKEETWPGLLLARFDPNSPTSSTACKTLTLSLLSAPTLKAAGLTSPSVAVALSQEGGGKVSFYDEDHNPIADGIISDLWNYLADNGGTLNLLMQGDSVGPMTLKATMSMGNTITEDILNITVWDLSIAEPAMNADYDIAAQPDYNQASLGVKGVVVPTTVSALLDAATISWDLNLQYQTSWGRAVGSDARAAVSASGQRVAQTYNSMGGRIVGRASVSISGATIVKTTTCTITGVAIPDNRITDRLTTLYGGHCIHLLCAVCLDESSYAQFLSGQTLYGRTDCWPTECPDNPGSGTHRGDYIGLMQVPVTMQMGWEWLANTLEGNSVFASKLALADQYQDAVMGAHPGLRPFTADERENYALSRYAGYQNDLYVFNGDSQNPDWMVNPNTGGMTYVTRVRGLLPNFD